MQISKEKEELQVEKKDFIELKNKVESLSSGTPGFGVATTPGFGDLDLPVSQKATAPVKEPGRPKVAGLWKPTILQREGV